MNNKEEKYLCFADFEFTCGYCINKFESEMLSVGIVICDTKYNIVEKFYHTSKPNHFPELTKQCRKLTHLTQQEINNSPDSDDIMRIVVGLLQQYNINKIYVWGNFDKLGLISDVRQHKKFKKSFFNIRTVSKKIYDIQEELTGIMQLPEPVNIQKLAYVFDYEPSEGTFHNALNDAMALYVIYRSVYITDLSKNKKLKEIRLAREEKIEQIRLETEKRQKETALSMPLSNNEKLYYSGIQGDEKKIKDFIYLRSKFVRALINNPDEEIFVFLYLNTSERYKVTPKKKYNNTLKSLSEKTIEFQRDNFSEILLNECKKSSVAEMVL